MPFLLFCKSDSNFFSFKILYFQKSVIFAKFYIPIISMKHLGHLWWYHIAKECVFICFYWKNRKYIIDKNMFFTNCGTQLKLHCSSKVYITQTNFPLIDVILIGYYLTLLEWSMTKKCMYTEIFTYNKITYSFVNFNRITYRHIHWNLNNLLNLSTGIKQIINIKSSCHMTYK